MNKKEGAGKGRGDGKSKAKKPDSKGKENVKKKESKDDKGKPKNSGSADKHTKDAAKRANKSPSKSDNKEKSKSATKPTKSTKPTENMKVAKKTSKGVTKSPSKDVKSPTKAKHTKDVATSRSSKDHKVNDSSAKRKTVTADSKRSPSKNRDNDRDLHKKAADGGHKKKPADSEHKKSPDEHKKGTDAGRITRSKSPKPKTPTPEPKQVSPISNYEILNSANNPDTHKKKLETVVKRKEYVPPTGAAAKHMWDPEEVKKAMDSENKDAQNFDAEKFHKEHKVRQTSPAPKNVRPHSKTISFNPKENKRADTDEVVHKPKEVRSVNFSGAKKEQQRRKSAQQRQGRGRALLSLIDLFEQEFDLFEMEPASYDQIMANFGKSGMQQGSSQTNEDDLTEELQTDEIRMRVKWTQHPIQFDVKVVTNNEGEVVSGPTYYDYLGVGGDMEEEDEPEERRQSSAIRLNKFLGAAGQCMLMLLEEELARTGRTDSRPSAGRLSFTSTSTRLGDGVAALLAGRSVSHLSFCDSDNKLLLTAHGGRGQGAGQTTASEPPAAAHTAEDAEGPGTDHCGLLCVWSVNEPSQPQKVLVTSAQPSRCCFSPDKPRLAFAGCEDGSLDVWDLHEPASDHTGVRRSAGQAALRSPTYSTAEILRADSHTDRLVALRPVPVGSGDASDAGAEPGSFQVCSMDCGGRLVFWVALSSQHHANLKVLDGDLGLAPWGRVKLVKISHVSVDDFIDQNGQKTFTEVHDFRIHPTDPSHIYVSTDSGTIVHCTRQGNRATPRLFRPEIELSVPVRCLAFCPFDHPYLLAGSADGSLRLHSISGERPLITWNNAADGAPILAVAWSRCRPCVFFVLDADSKIHVWDLSAGDIFPAEIDQVKGGQVTAMDLSYGLENDKQVAHLAVSTDSGSVEVHKISDSYTSKTEQEAAAEMDQFLHYVQII